MARDFYSHPDGSFYSIPEINKLLEPLAQSADIPDVSGFVSFKEAQDLSAAQKAQALSNVGAAAAADIPDVSGFVSFDEAQELSAEQKTQALSNVGAAASDDPMNPKNNTLAENTDLDNVSVDGFYNAASNSIAASLSNCPTSSAFIMMVFTRGEGTTLKTQVIFQPGNIYIRAKSSQAWGSWYTVALTAVS